MNSKKHDTLFKSLFTLTIYFIIQESIDRNICLSDRMKSGCYAYFFGVSESHYTYK